MENARTFWSERADMHTARKQMDMRMKREIQTTVARHSTANGSLSSPRRIARLAGVASLLLCIPAASFAGPASSSSTSTTTAPARRRRFANGG